MSKIAVGRSTRAAKVPLPLTTSELAVVFNGRGKNEISKMIGRNF